MVEWTRAPGWTPFSVWAGGTRQSREGMDDGSMLQRRGAELRLYPRVCDAGDDERMDRRSPSAWRGRMRKKWCFSAPWEEPEMTTRGVVGRTTRRRAIDGVAGQTAPETTGFQSRDGRGQAIGGSQHGKRWGMAWEKGTKVRLLDGRRALRQERRPEQR